MRSDERLGLSSDHFSDDQLMELYVLAGDDRHLATCRHCRSRFEDLGRVLDQMRDTAVHEADAIFTAERLHDQRERILRRIDRHGHPAEVVAFPHRGSGNPAVQRVLGPARRWVAAAAAAGVAAGMFLGFAVDRSTHSAEFGTRPIPPSVVVAAPAAWQTADPRDDQFLLEIDDAVTGFRAAELLAIDSMTTPLEIQEASYPR